MRTLILLLTPLKHSILLNTQALLALYAINKINKEEASNSLRRRKKTVNIRQALQLGHQMYFHQVDRSIILKGSLSKKSHLKLLGT